MDASKVTIGTETRLAMMNNPLLTSRKAKSKFRQQRLLDYIRSKPAGTTFGMNELIAVAGYTEKQYATGWAWVNRLARDKIIWIEKNNKFKKLVTIPSDSHLLNEPEQPNASAEEPEVPQPEAEKPTGLVGNVTVLYTVEDIVHNAKQFAWEHNSDSLRDYVASLQ